MTSGRIERLGVIKFGDASLHIYEEGISEARKRGGYAGTQAWERQFKRDVFARVVQTLNRLGWTCVIPADKIEQYGMDFARGRRYCRKGDLQADLEITGRCISLKMFQDVNAPDRPDHGGRYQNDLEGHMPYVLRLEMERTRRRIRGYLCNVFTAYEFVDKSSDGRSARLGFMHSTALGWIADSYRTSWHFKGDTTKYEISGCNRKAADGAMLEHGQPVWFFDYRGQVKAGTAHYNINNMWWVAMGRYDVTNVGAYELYTKCPDNPRIKRNSSWRRKRIKVEMAAAIKAMKFERAALLRDILFPGEQALFNVWHDEHQAYHRPGFCGYTTDQSQAGKFTSDEVRGWDRAPNRAIQFAAQEAA